MSAPVGDPGGWFRVRGRLLGAVLLSLAAGCSERPVGPPAPIFEVVVAGGDGQYGTAGEELTQPLRVVVRDSDSLHPAADVSVRWAVASGDAQLVGTEVRTTSEAGLSEIRLRLGSTEGPITVTASLLSGGTASASLDAFLVGRPTVDEVAPVTADAGGTVVLTGTNFSPDPDQNVVLFSGVRGRVVDATPSRMEVIVPECLPTRDIEVHTRLGAVASGALPLFVNETGGSAPLNVGEVVDIVDEEGFACLRLSGASEAQYLAVVHTTSTVGAATYPFELTGLAAAGAGAETAAVGRGVAARPVEAWSGSDPRGAVGAQERFEERLRRAEAELVEDRAPAPALAPQPLSAPRMAPGAAVPQQGDRRTFFVYNGMDPPDDGFDEVTATARHVGTSVALFVDDGAPSPGFSDGDLAAFAARFDDVIDPTVRNAFGDPSDLDGNDRIVVLFTPVVNRLTEGGSDSFVGGFFYGRDLLPELEYSNVGEIFYALVPDPRGDFSDPRSAELVLDAVPAILAHEFQHMVHFNERVLRLGARQEALWMLEGLAQMAEELVARTYLRASDAESGQLFREGNRRRAQLYLEAPDTASLIVSTGRGTLAERGAGFLFLLYLDQQFGGDLMGRLTRTGRTGVSNVEAEVGRAWSLLLPDWWAALYLDEMNIGSSRLAYPEFDLPLFLRDPPPLIPELLGDTDFTRAARLPSSAGTYYLLAPPEGGSTSVRLGGEGGGVHATGAELRLRIVRVS